MSGDNYKQDFAAMKKLLISWHVEILYDLFKEEDIAIEELKMMQFCHINSLLKNYKMGVRIRFEHNLNNWRNKIGIPLKKIETNRLNTCCCHFNKPFYENGNGETFNNNIVENSTAKKRKNDDEDLLVNDDPAERENTQPLLSPYDTKSEKPLNSNATCIDTTLTPLTILGSPIHQTNHIGEKEENENFYLSTLTDFLTTTLEEETPTLPPQPTLDKCPISLRHILESSGTKGMSIINFYNEKKHLTNVQRGQLIQIIVDFFYKNDYHLSLYMSHNLEKEILKKFPNEKLEYYRIGKRGKIYVKFSNMKRFKRERNNKAKSETEIRYSGPRRSLNHNHQLDGFNVDKNALIDNDDNDADWPMVAETEIRVKEENMESI